MSRIRRLLRQLYEADDPEMFVSPNVRHLKLGEAQRALRSVRQTAMNSVSRHINKLLGIKETHRANAVGAWSDGAENSMMVGVQGHPDRLRVAAALHGAVTNQKSVLLFQPHGDGNENMASFETKGSLADIHDHLLHHDLEFHTLEPTEGGARVHIWSPNQETNDRIVQAAGDNHVQFSRGSGELIGAEAEGRDFEQRAASQREYRKVLHAYKGAASLGGRDPEALWRSAHHHWRQATGQEDPTPLRQQNRTFRPAGVYNPAMSGHRPVRSPPPGSVAANARARRASRASRVLDGLR